MYAAVGWGMFAIGNILRFASMRFAAQTVLSGLGSLQFVIMPFSSRSLLGIQPQLSTGIGVFIVLIGNLFIIVFGPPEETFTLAELRHQWNTPSMKLFLLILVILLGLLHGAWRIVHYLRRLAEAAKRAEIKIKSRKGKHYIKTSIGGSEDAAEIELVKNDSPQLNIGKLEMSLENQKIEDPNTVRMFTAALLFSAVSSFIGAWSVLFSKSLTYIVGEMPASLKDPYAWFTIFAFLGTAVYWVRQSNKGLRLYPATLIMPLMQAFWMAMSVLEGMIYFDETKTLSISVLYMLIFGLVLAIIGAVAMGLSGFWNEVPRSTAEAHFADGTRNSREFQASGSDVEKLLESRSLDDIGSGKGTNLKERPVLGNLINMMVGLLPSSSTSKEIVAGNLGNGFYTDRKESGVPLSPFLLSGVDGKLETAEVEEATGWVGGASSPVQRNTGPSGSLSSVLARELSLVAQRHQRNKR